jgi:hypothetical protein
VNDCSSFVVKKWCVYPEMPDFESSQSLMWFTALPTTKSPYPLPLPDLPRHSMMPLLVFSRGLTLLRLSKSSLSAAESEFAVAFMNAKEAAYATHYKHWDINKTQLQS